MEVSYWTKTPTAEMVLTVDLLGHNRIVTYAPVGLAVLRAFEDL